MTRISDYANQQLLLSSMQATQKRMRQHSYQVSTQFNSPTYSGIINDAQRLLNLEQRVTETEGYIQDNNATDLKMIAVEQSLESIDTVVTDFREALTNLKQNNPANEQQVSEIQKLALQSIKDISAYLNIDIDGQYIFAGAKTDRQPVDLANIGAEGSLADFQARWDGAQATYPISRDQQLNFPQEVTLADTGALTFNDNDPAADSIVAATDQAFANFTAGDTIYLNGTPAGYNGYYTIASIGDTDLGGAETQNTITLNPNAELTDSGGAVAYTGLTITSNTSYYRGDNTVNTVKIDTDRTIDLDLNAQNPAFEKAIRALGLIAQGEYGTPGGLDQNTDRVDDALWLLDSSLDFPTQGTAPNGQTELTDSIENIQFDFSYKRVRLTEASEQHTSFVGTLKSQIADIEVADPLESVTRLLDESRALEASYQAVGRINELSLVDFLR